MSQHKLVVTALAAFLALRVAGQAPATTPPVPAPTPAPTPEPVVPSFSAEVEQVLVDVVVTDKKGKPITDLSKLNFAVTEDGVPQTLESFDAVRSESTPTTESAQRPAISSNLEVTLPGQAGRVFVIVFDDVHLTPFDARQAKLAVAEFLKNGAKETDRVTIVATGGAAWWTARTDAAGRNELLAVLKRLEGRLIIDNSPDRMSDYEAMRIHTFNDPEVEQRVTRRYESRGVTNQASQTDDGFDRMLGDPYVRGRATEVYFQALSRNRLTLEIVARLLASMQGVRGRKSMILVSGGFIYDPNMDEFKSVVQASRRANAAMYFVNVKGLEGMPSGFSAEFGPSMDSRDMGAALGETYEASAGAEALAADSGGFTVRDTNDLAKGIQRIADETRSYYLLGYSSSNNKRDGRFRKIQVKLDRRGVEVRARKGYYAPLEGGKPPKLTSTGADPVLQTAIDSPFMAQDLPLRLTALVSDETLLGKAQTVVLGDVDIERFALEQKEGRSNGSLQFLMVVSHRETGEYFRYDQQIDMNLLPETRQRLRAQWFQVAKEFELAPGGYQAKLVVRDKRSGKVGTVAHNFEVPELGTWRVSSPILTDVRLPDPPGQPVKAPRLQPVARRSFPSGATTLFCSYEVYGAARDQSTNQPKVEAGYVIRKTDGTEVTRVAPSLITPTSLGRLSRMTGSGLEGAEPGEYEFVIKLTDQVAGKTMEIKEPFTIVPSVPEPETPQAKEAAK